MPASSISVSLLALSGILEGVCTAHHCTAHHCTAEHGPSRYSTAPHRTAGIDTARHRMGLRCAVDLVKLS